MLPAVTDLSQAMLTAFAGALAMLFAAIPKVLGFMLILVIGWLVASLIARATAGLLRAIKFNDLAARSGFTAFVRNIGVQSDAAVFLALVAKWFVRLIVLVVAFDALGLPAVSEVLRQLLLWLPNLAVGLVVLVIGGLLANAAAARVRAATASAGFHRPQLLANIARTAVWVFAIIVAVDQIGIAQALVNTLFMGTVALLVLALGLSFGLGGRELAATLLQKWYAESQAKAPQMREAVREAADTSREGSSDPDPSPPPGGRPARGWRGK